MDLSLLPTAFEASCFCSVFGECLRVTHLAWDSAACIGKTRPERAVMATSVAAPLVSWREGFQYTGVDDSTGTQGEAEGDYV